MEKENLFQQLEMLQDEKDIDKIADLFLLIISMYGLKVDEVSALSYYMVEKTLKSENNAKFLKDEINLDVNNLGIEGVLAVQQAMIARYIDEVTEGEKR